MSSTSPVRRTPEADDCSGLSYEITRPMSSAIRWFMGLMLHVDDRTRDLTTGMATTLQQIKTAVET